MPRMLFFEASEALHRAGVDRNKDFHALPISAIDGLLREADRHKYRKPKNANGSRARYFHAYLMRCLNRKGTHNHAQSS